jgi:hypothetical protein
MNHIVALMLRRRSAEHVAMRSAMNLERRCRELIEWLRQRERRLTEGCDAQQLQDTLNPSHLVRQSKAWTNHRCVEPRASAELARVRGQLKAAQAALDRAIRRRQSVERLEGRERRAREVRRRRTQEHELVEVASREASV